MPMKTTIDISDPLLAQAKALAAREKLTLRALVEQGLRHVLQVHAKPVRKFRLKPAAFKGKGLQPHARALDWDSIRAMS
jgi:hypothetical protein